MNQSPVFFNIGCAMQKHDQLVRSIKNRPIAQFKLIKGLNSAPKQFIARHKETLHCATLGIAVTQVTKNTGFANMRAWQINTQVTAMFQYPLVHGVVL